MRIRHKIFLGYMAIVAVSVVLVAAFLFTLFDIQHHYTDLLTRDQQMLLQSNNLRSSIEREIVAARTYEQLGSASLLDEYQAAKRDQESAFTEMTRLVTDADDRLSLTDIQAASTRYSRAAEDGMDLAKTHQWQELDALKRTEGEPSRVALLNKVEAYIQRENNEVSTQQQALATEVDEASTRLLLGAIVGIVAALLAATLLTEGITSPLRRLMRNIQRISGGDLETAVAVRSRDEIGELASVLETMRRRLAATAAENEDLLKSAREEAEKLARTRQELEEANAELGLALTTEHEARKHIEGINRLKAEFTSMVSHELKTPVSYVYNYAGALKEHNDSLNEGQRREFLTAIQSEAQHLLTLIDDIMAVSLLESGGLSHRFVETDLRKLTDSVVKDQQLTTRRHTLTVKGPETLPVNADPNRLKQVLNNLLSNAIKYSPQGGAVEVRLRANPGDGTALIYVRDNGIGIRPADVPKLFDRFTRIQRRETMAIPGSGLGLYIAHQIIKAHGGTLSLEPAPGKGTIAQATVPLLVKSPPRGTDGAKDGSGAIGSSNGAANQDGGELLEKVIVQGAEDGEPEIVTIASQGSPVYGAV